MNEQLYNIANEAPSPNNNNHRKQYTLGSVAVTGGGLKNSDRTLLAYSNADSENHTDSENLRRSASTRGSGLGCQLGGRSA
mmetsp:Transcript_23673/g.42551  ORF Transcript_23673/g.42551 Transcript_23673/m.42551 type:complete len:81 (+) Transcript_23673:475-717(+)